jgi:hypothetical protein
MSKIIVVGDSVAQGIGGAITGAKIFAAQGAKIEGMGEFFSKATAEAGQGDTVIVSAGYNSTGPEGLSKADEQRLQGWVQQLRDKGAKVVISGLRDEDMAGSYAHLNGRTTKTNTALERIAAATGATFSQRCRAIAGMIPNGEIHGHYNALALECVQATGADNGVVKGLAEARAKAAGTATAQSAAEENEEDKPWYKKIGSFLSSGLSGLMTIVMGLFSWIGSFFGGGDKKSEPAQPAVTPTVQAQRTPDRDLEPGPAITREAAAQADAAVSRTRNQVAMIDNDFLPVLPAANQVPAASLNR